jgi:GNAT superfamily N-acetyltransferase
MPEPPVAVPQDPESDPLLLRPGAPAEAPAIAALIRRENRRPADEPAIAASLASAPSVVAVDGDELVAFFYGRPFAPDIVEMQNMLISARHRRRGLGRRMVARAEDDLRAAGYRAAIGSNSVLHQGTTPERCMAARAFWLRMGWHIVLATGGSVVLVRWLGPPPRPGSGQGVAAAVGSVEGASPDAPAISS